MSTQGPSHPLKIEKVSDEAVDVPKILTRAMHAINQGQYVRFSRVIDANIKQYIADNDAARQLYKFLKSENQKLPHHPDWETPFSSPVEENAQYASQSKIDELLSEKSKELKAKRERAILLGNIDPTLDFELVDASDEETTSQSSSISSSEESSPIPSSPSPSSSTPTSDVEERSDLYWNKNLRKPTAKQKESDLEKFQKVEKDEGNKSKPKK